MTDYTMTASERRIVEFIGWNAEGKDWTAIRENARLTTRGLRTVMHRLEDYGWIYRKETAGHAYGLTFKGARVAGLLESQTA